jgi:hypothetical protein
MTVPHRGAARHTQDIDLRYHGEIEPAQTELDAAANRDLGDFFSFDIEQTGTLAGTTSGRKYRVVAYIGDAKFADFQIDAVVDSNMTGVPDHAPGLRPIDIDGLITADYRIYPVVDHLADKLVAMTSTFASDRPSTRYRDLVDIVLIAQTQTVEASALRTAVESERLHRNHSMPERLKLPDTSWTYGYAAIAQTVAGLDVPNAADALAIAVSLYRPVFENLVDGIWDPSRCSGLSRAGVPNSCLEEHSTGCNTAQQRTTLGLPEPDLDLAKHPTRRHDAISLEALPKLNTRVRFPSSAPCDVARHRKGPNPHCGSGLFVFRGPLGPPPGLPVPW